LETDRGAVLTVRAALRKVVDFSKARITDVNWWRKANLLIRRMADDDNLLVLRAAFDYQRSLVGNSGTTDESFKASQKAAQKLMKSLQSIVYPWDVARADTEVNNLIDSYKKMIGDPDDPTFQRKLLHDLETQKSQEDAEKPETEDERINRLLAERDAHYAKQKLAL